MVFEQLQIIVFRNALRRNQFSANTCILLWISNKIWNSGAQRKNGCIHPQQDSYELSFRCILRYCPHPPLVFPLIICIYDSLYLTISCNYKCFSSLWFSVDKFICGMKLKIIYFLALENARLFFQSTDFLPHSPMGKCKSCVKIENDRSWVSN